LVRRFGKKYLKDISKKIKTTTWYFFDATRVWKSTKWKWQKKFFFLRLKKKSYERTCRIFLRLFSLRQLVNKFYDFFFFFIQLFFQKNCFWTCREEILLPSAVSFSNQNVVVRIGMFFIFEKFVSNVSYLSSYLD
jgi:hypothetical protein